MCSLCPTCKHYTYVSGSSNPNRCDKGSSLTMKEATEFGDCTSYAKK